MSSLFQWAAMTLLSKTLQTLLYKYLEDVDVEGIALPSMISSSGNDSWGVRLSNVKLRPQASLMELSLPTTRKSFKSKRRKKRKHKKRSHNTSTTTTTTTSTVPTTTTTTTTVETTITTLETNNNQEIHLESKTSNIDMDNDVVVPPSIVLDMNVPTTTQSAPSKTPAKRSSSSSWFRGWYSSSKDENNEIPSTLSSQDNPNLLLDNSGSDKPTIQDDGSSNEPQQQCTVNNANNDSASNSTSNTTATILTDKDNTELQGTKETAPQLSSPSPNTTTNPSAKVPTTTEENSQTTLQPMILRLGENSRIGTLDIRLVGTQRKNFYVQVEDADLTLELLPREDSTTPSDDPATISNHSNHNKQPTPPAPSNTLPKKKNTSSHAQKTDATTTLQERVLAENPIARIFALLPNLLLRDVRLRLILRDCNKKRKKAKEDRDPDQNENRQDLDLNPEKTTFDSDDNHNHDPSIWEENQGHNSANEDDSTDPNLSHEEEEDDPVMIELYIELLSITDGKDFLAHLRSPNNRDGAHPDGDDNDSDEDDDGDEESSADEQEERRYHPPMAVPNSKADNSIRNDNGDADEDEEDPNAETPAIISWPKNDYVTKRIRTGRGTDGGITLRIVPGAFWDIGKNDNAKKQMDDTMSSWPGQRWMSHVENHVVLRCSGVDVQARILVGTKIQVQFQGGSSSWYSPEGGPDEEDVDDAENDYSMDALLFAGVDSIVPGPPPSLPPFFEQPTSTETIFQTAPVVSPVLWGLPGATTYQLDNNGIQYSWVKTSFHRIGRGLLPTICASHVHLPCEYCDYCWQRFSSSSPYPDQHQYENDSKPHALDAAAPLGGLVLQVSIRDILEINLNRSVLEVIGLAIQLLQRPAPEVNLQDQLGGEDNTTRSTEASPASLQNDNADVTGVAPSLNTEQPTSRNSESNISAEKTEPCTNAKSNDVDYGDLTNAFPTYMQPEKIQYLGLYISEIKLRVHVMQAEPDVTLESKYCFSYWDARAKCITLDFEKLSGDVKEFQDVRFDVGHFRVMEYKGVEEKQLVSMGLHQRVVDFDDMTVETLMTREEDCLRPPWPSTAAVLLDISPTLESLVYETRERHAVQLRFVALRIAGIESNKSFRNQETVHVKLGASSMDVPKDIVDVARSTIQHARACIFPRMNSSNNTSDTTPPSPPPKLNNLLRYKVDLDGARVYLNPILTFRVPLSTVRGELSSSSGFSIETILDHVQVVFGKKEQFPIAVEKRLSLTALASLPESLRLRILFFLEDLNPLAVALGVTSSPFLLHRAISKQIDKLVASKSRRIRKPANTHGSGNQRQTILTELLKLDDDSLERLWETHLRQQRRQQVQRRLAKPH